LKQSFCCKVDFYTLRPVVIIAERTLFIATSSAPAMPIAVRLYAPEKAANDWSCTYEIDWPEGLRRFSVFGMDGVQALLLASKCVGSELYASKHHADGSLVWHEKGQGYGFPVAESTKPDLVGDDRRFES
jgi:hypothetical protein